MLHNNSCGIRPKLTIEPESPFPPVTLATLIAAQHMRPLQVLPLLFPTALLFSTYLNLADYKTESAGVTAAWSALYFVLARRRKQPFTKRWGARGIVRGVTMGMCAANLAGCGIAYMVGKPREKETPEVGEDTV